MRKFSILSITIFITIILAGAFGMVHDEITYTISKEYFTKFKYPQFGFTPSLFGGNRQTVAAIGFLATWWVGLFIGIITGLTALLFRDPGVMKKEISKAIRLIFLITILFSTAGYFYGRYHLTKTGVTWWLPADLTDKYHYIITGSIHNFSYMGGLAGLFLAVVLMLRKIIFQRSGA